jgi:crotonobetainyl-CoA:carnitine CoA-transferase CaiB-like acyl-CoA transferase
LLSCYRILDLTDERGYLCGKVFSDLGSEVIKIEKPGGDPGRSRGPFFHDIADPEKSLYWFAFNTNKKSITLDIETEDGKAIFKNLVKNVDVVIESYDPGFMDSLGLGYSVLSQINPQIVMSSITAFGQKGPYRNYASSDIAVTALSGVMYITGDADRPPLVSSYPHAFLFPSMEAAAGIMVALFNRATLGHGQYIDASAQQSLIQLAGPEVEGLWQMEGKIYSRRGRNRWRITTKDGEYYAPLLWQCKDGEVGFTVMLGLTRARANKALGQWMESEGIDSGPLLRINLETTGWMDVTVSDAEAIFKGVEQLMRRHTKAEIYEGAKKRELQLVPSLSMGERIDFPHLVARKFWEDVDYPELGTKLTHPGAAVKFYETPQKALKRAPLIGENNNEIYQKELGFTQTKLVDLKQRRVI